jgi:hypothetical protein
VGRILEIMGTKENRNFFVQDVRESVSAVLVWQLRSVGVPGSYHLVPLYMDSFSISWPKTGSGAPAITAEFLPA